MPEKNEADAQSSDRAQPCPRCRHPVKPEGVINECPSCDCIFKIKGVDNDGPGWVVFHTPSGMVRVNVLRDGLHQEAVPEPSVPKSSDNSMLFDHLEMCWLPQLSRYSETLVNEFVERVPNKAHEGHGQDRRKYRIYTAENCYSIIAVVKEDGNTYLGCGASTRKPRAGEAHTRGNDLPDGKFCHDTWLGIVHAIVAYELVKLEPKVEGKEVTKEEGDGSGE